LRKCRADTKEAAALFDLTRECILTTGEVSETLSYAWDELALRSTMMEAAE
jgi:hypothetical protein